MAKDQSLPLNPTKISGCCGRLMCCLKYEHQVYVSFRKRAPKRGAIVRTPAGEGRVTDLLAPVDSVTVDLGEGRSETFKLDELGSAASSRKERQWLTTHAVLNVPTVSCNHCKMAIEKAVGALDGVKVDVDVAEKTVTVDFDDSAVSLERDRGGRGGRGLRGRREPRLRLLTPRAGAPPRPFGKTAAGWYHIASLRGPLA